MVQQDKQYAHRSGAQSRGIPSAILFVSIAAAMIIGYVAGTRNDEIMASIGPLFGVKVATGTLDTAELQKTYRQLKANFDGTLDDKTLQEGAERGMVAAAGDKYTVYMDAKEAQQFQGDLSGAIGGGIGAQIGQRSGKAVILRTLSGDPAEAAGLHAGDTIVAVDGTDASSLTVDEVVAKIRGDVGTKVKVTVLRDGKDLSFDVTRATINSPSVSSDVKDGVGILTISRFDDETGTLARKAAESFKQQGVKGVVLDLRGNGGGYVTAAQAVAGLWLDDKLVVTEKAGSKTLDTAYSTDRPVLAGIPTVVLVNSGTASASEIVSGAFKDYKIATLLGEKTFGKGSVQSIISLDGGAILKVTIAKWYTPNGQNINQSGIVPDQEVGLTQDNLDKGDDTQLNAALALLRK